MYPVLFGPEATSFDSFGIGVLSDAISCEVEENRNGAYELELTYPITGVFFDHIALRCLIVAKPNYTDDPQPFRIYNVSKPLNGIVTISAQHISYDLSGYIDAPFSAAGLQDALQQMVNDNIVYPTDCPFVISSDITSTASKPMTVTHPASVRSLMGGVQGSLLDTYGGEWHFDRYTCSINAARGENRGVLIRYGKNLTDLRQEENNAKVYTAVYPYYYNKDTGDLVTLTEKVINVPGTFPYTKVLELDLTMDFQEPPTEQQLRSDAENYIAARNIGVPDINLTISFIESDAFQERVDLCDTVSVNFDALGVSASAKCIRTKWDVLKGRYIEAELGSARNSLAKSIATSSEMTEVIDEHTSQFTTIMQSIASVVTGNTGGSIVLHDSDNDGKPDEILILDNEDLTLAVNVIRMNKNGIAFSKDGYNGEYRTAWNINGQFVADFIASGELRTQSVKILGDSNFFWDSNNITVVDPTNNSRMIRFGRYDGQNYGLGFSVDGGITWSSGFNFNGITLVKPGSNGVAGFRNNYFFINDDDQVTICRLGEGSCVNDSFQKTQGPYYQLGISKGTTRSDPSIRYDWDETHGLRSFNAGIYNLPRGSASTTIGYSNEALARYAIGIGYMNNAYGAAAVAIGESNTCDFCPHEDPDAYPNGYISGIAIGYKNHSYEQGSIAIGLHNESKSYGSACIGNKLIASADNQCVLGDRNEESSTATFIIGNGTFTIDPNTGEEITTRRNILELSSNGDMYITGSYRRFSDAKSKRIIGEAPDLSGIRAVRYKWNDSKYKHDDKEHVGYIAQDVEVVAPYLVEEQHGVKTLDYIELLCAKVEHLEKKVAQLMQRVTELEASRQ